MVFSAIRLLSFISLIITPLLIFAFYLLTHQYIGSVSGDNRGVASGMLATMKNVGMVLGVALSGALFSELQRSAKNRFGVLKISAQELQNKLFTYALHITLIVAGSVQP